MKTNAAKLLRNIGLFFGIALVTALLADRCSVGVPTHRRVAEFTGGDLSFQLTPEFPSPYHFVISVPAGLPSPPPFSGTIEIREGERIVASVPITADTVEPCNWLHDAPGVSAYILAWHAPQQISAILHRGTTYQIQISFAQSLPAGCALWFASMRRASIIFNRNA